MLMLKVGWLGAKLVQHLVEGKNQLTDVKLKEEFAESS